MDELAREFLEAAARARGGLPEGLAEQIAVVFVADLREQFYGGHGPDGTPHAPLRHQRPNGGSIPLMNTAVLANSYTAVVDASGVSVGSNHPGAAAHQYGAIIRPVKAKALAIPITVEARRFASPRRFLRALFVDGRGLAERVGDGKKARLVRHYLFVRSVTIPARPVGFSRQAQRDAEEMVMDYYSGGV